ncbi:hypothetical protein RRF57_008511 [Xylaria bambusicola]|uniref:Uncharacterized protein n=1 Tax=Xylaria bambusicola TaxID=326684 RepID=A0AAN7Z8E6_9PEZI
MPHATFTSTTTSSDYIPSTYTTGQTPSYPRTLDITSDTSSSGSSPSSFSSSSTTRPLMGYSINFTSDWKKDFDGGVRKTQERRSWSTRGDTGNNP